MSSANIGSSVLQGSQSTSTSGGLGSGIDISSLVSAALANQTAELNLLQSQQTTVSNQQTALDSINTDLQTLSNAVFALTDPAGQLTDLTATSSNSSVATATAVSGAVSGSHTVVVSNLATTSSEYSAAQTSETTAIPTGTLQIQVGSNTPTTITIDSTNNTLDGLAQSINSANAGVTASIINDANGSRLAIVSNTSGAPGNLTITSSGGALAFTQAVQGVNASLTVDGIPISSTSNTVSSAIPGATLNLLSPDAGSPVTLTVGAAVADQESVINNFVSAYNTVIGDLNTQFAVDPTSGQPGPLAADSTLYLAQNQILATASFAMPGNGAINTLADLGITMNNDGTLSVDSNTLSSALQSDPSAVQSFFQEATTGSFGSNLTSTINSLADASSGAIAQDLNGYSQTQTSLAAQISDFETQLSAQTTALTAQYVQVDTTLQELPLLLSQTQSQLASLG
jgi:flagellar hook-associated protein 2